MISTALGLALKLNVAPLGNRGLLDCDHLALHLSEFGRVLLVTLDEESAPAWSKNSTG